MPNVESFKKLAHYAAKKQLAQIYELLTIEIKETKNEDERETLKTFRDACLTWDSKEVCQGIIAYTNSLTENMDKIKNIAEIIKIANRDIEAFQKTLSENESSTENDASFFNFPHESTQKHKVSALKILKAEAAILRNQQILNEINQAWQEIDHYEGFLALHRKQPLSYPKVPYFHFKFVPIPKEISKEIAENLLLMKKKLDIEASKKNLLANQKIADEYIKKIKESNARSVKKQLIDAKAKDEKLVSTIALAEQSEKKLKEDYRLFTLESQNVRLRKTPLGKLYSGLQDKEVKDVKVIEKLINEAALSQHGDEKETRKPIKIISIPHEMKAYELRSDYACYIRVKSPPKILFKNKANSFTDVPIRKGVFEFSKKDKDKKFESRTNLSEKQKETLNLFDREVKSTTTMTSLSKEQLEKIKSYIDHDPYNGTFLTDYEKIIEEIKEPLLKKQSVEKKKEAILQIVKKYYDVSAEKVNKHNTNDNLYQIGLDRSLEVKNLKETSIEAKKVNDAEIVKLTRSLEEVELEFKTQRQTIIAEKDKYLAEESKKKNSQTLSPPLSRSHSKSDSDEKKSMPMVTVTESSQISSGEENKNYELSSTVDNYEPYSILDPESKIIDSKTSSLTVKADLNVLETYLDEQLKSLSNKNIYVLLDVKADINKNYPKNLNTQLDYFQHRISADKINLAKAISEKQAEQKTESLPPLHPLRIKHKILVSIECSINEILSAFVASSKERLDSNIQALYRGLLTYKETLKTERGLSSKFTGLFNIEISETRRIIKDLIRYLEKTNIPGVKESYNAKCNTDRRNSNSQ